MLFYFALQPFSVLVCSFESGVSPTYAVVGQSHHKVEPKEQEPARFNVQFHEGTRSNN